MKNNSLKILLVDKTSFFNRNQLATLNIPKDGYIQCFLLGKGGAHRYGRLREMEPFHILFYNAQPRLTYPF